jgi:hypothetical protein
MAYVARRMIKSVQMISLTQHSVLTEIGIFSKTQMVMRDASAVSRGRLGLFAEKSGSGAQMKKYYTNRYDAIGDKLSW